MQQRPMQLETPEERRARIYSHMASSSQLGHILEDRAEEIAQEEIAQKKKRLVQISLNRKRVKRVLAVFASVLLLALLGLGDAIWQWNRTVVTVVNESSQAVDMIEIKMGGGGRYALGYLLPGQSRSVRVNEYDESAGNLVFINAANQSKKSKAFYIYRPRLTITKNETVVYEEKTWPQL